MTGLANSFTIVGATKCYLAVFPPAGTCATYPIMDSFFTLCKGIGGGLI